MCRAHRLSVLCDRCCVLADTVVAVIVILLRGGGGVGGWLMIPHPILLVMVTGKKIAGPAHFASAPAVCGQQLSTHNRTAYQPTLGWGCNA